MEKNNQRGGAKKRGIVGERGGKIGERETDKGRERRRERGDRQADRVKVKRRMGRKETDGDKDREAV